MKKRNIIILMISLSLILLLGSSYAFLVTTVLGSNPYTLRVGDLQVRFQKDTVQKLNLSNAIPTSDEEGLSKEDELIFTVENKGTLDARYNVYIEETSKGLEFKNVIRFASNKNETEYDEPKTLGSDKYIDYYAYLEPDDTANYKVKTWLAESADNTYMSEGENKKEFKAKVVVEASQAGYKEEILNGADPVIIDPLVAVTISPGGEVTKADMQEKWYSYAEKEWANAVILVDNPSKEYKVGEKILESDIESYFVWIPRYKYKVWNMAEKDGYYELSQITDDANKETSFHKLFGNARIIDIQFESKDTPKASASKVGDYLTHPAFTLGETELSGIWVGKFETGYNQGEAGKPILDTKDWTTAKAQVNEVKSEKIIVKPNVYSWRYSTVSNFFKSAYGYERYLESHMMKNTEWGAVAYLSHSLYGIGTEVRINNNNQYKTGYSANINTNQSSYPGESGNTSDKTQPYNSVTGYMASTTGNITGVYDMSGGAHEYMAAYRPNSSGDASGFQPNELTEYAKYLDVYENTTNWSNYSKRILGDATGEMGPFYYYYDADKDTANYKRSHNAWYADYSDFVETVRPWFDRGGDYTHGVLAGQFLFGRGTGGTGGIVGARLVLAKG